MATFDELNKYFDEYEAGPQQQQLGVNFNAPEQQETAYQKMMRETYGSPAQMQQEEPGLFGSIVNRVSGQPQQQGAEEPSYLNSFLRGAVQQGAGTLGGQVDLVAGATGSETARDIGDSIQKAVQNYGRPKEYTFDEITKNGLSSIKDYLLDPNGFTYDVGGGLGSSGVMMAEAALLSAAIPSSVAAAGTGAMAAFASKIGLKSVAAALKGGSTAGKLIKNVIASSPLEAGSESGGVYREMTTDKNGNRIDMSDADMDKVQEAMAKNFVANLGILGASNLLESVGIGRLFGDKMRQGILGKVRDIGEFMATNVAQNAWEEGAQTGASQYAQGQIDNISQIVNPMEWNTEQIDAATTGAAAGVGMGALYGGAGYVRNKIAGSQQQEGENPAVNIQNAVTNNEFADAVAIAKHDTSTNLVDRMRNLEGRIGHHASDGTNCARTIGLALAGTDYQDLINVDDFVKVAQQKGQLQDPANYVPKPGDLAVVNNGNHIVMVSENGGTIQNGSSHDGVYESSQSPLQMFGAVKYYISTSGMSSGEYGVAGNLQGVNEDQRKEDYYQNLVAQESQRRADAIREVLGAKTHEQEQQEQAVSEAQKYQQDNASELGPINEYYNAFTRQELDALSPEEKQALKNNFDSFYADKQNWGHTAIEKVQTARGMYNQLLGNRQQTPVVNNVTQPTPNSTQSAPNVTKTANTTANTTEVENPVVQQQQAQQNQDVAKNATTTTPTTTTTTPATADATEKVTPVAQQQNYKTRSEAAKDLPNRIQKAVTNAGGDYAKLHSALTTEATDLENDLSFGKITQDEYKTAKAQLDEAQNKHLYNKNNQTTQTDASPAEPGAMSRQAEEQKATDINITKNNRIILNQAKAAKKGDEKAINYMNGLPEHIRNAAYEQIETPREKFVDMVDELYKKKKRRQSEADKQLITSQANEAFKTGAAMIEQGATAEEAFNAVKDSIGTEKQKAKAKADAEKQARKEGKKNGTSQKSEKLSQPKTGENRNQNLNTESEKVEQQKGQTGESGQNQNQAEVTKKTPAKRHIDGFKNEVDAAVKSMTFTQEKADELMQKYNNSLDILLQRGEITQAEADANRYAMEDSVKRGLILNDGRKLLSPKVRKWLDENPFVYDKSKSREENAAVAQALKEKFIKDTGISSTFQEKLTPEREQLQIRILDYLYNVGIENRKRERKATLAIGYPAAGKSTVTKDLTDNKGYLLIDADEAKKLLPEFHNGVLADIVHDESSELSKALFRHAVTQGDNICWPTIGGNYDSLKKKISKLHNDAGNLDENTGKVLPPYEVTMSLVDISADEALKRISNRFEETGRFDNPKNISKLVLQKPDGYVTIQLPDGARKDRLGPTETVPIDNEILKNYLKIKNERGVERYEWIDNSLPVGSSYAEMSRESGELSGRPNERYESGNRQSRRGTGSGDSERNQRKTEKQQQVNRADTEGQSGSSVSGDVLKQIEDRIDKEFATEEERALARAIFTDKETPLKALEKRKKENKKRHEQDVNDFAELEYNALQNEAHQGVSLVPYDNDGRAYRASNNPKWYQDMYASYGGTPSKAMIRRLAIDVLTGENTDVWAERGLSKEAVEKMEPEFEKKRAELDAIDKRFDEERDLLDAITPGVEKINAEMKKEVSKYRREAKKTASQQEGVTGQNVGNEVGLRELSEGNGTGSLQQNEDGRATGNISGYENGTGETTLQADDGLVQNEESGTERDDGSGSNELPGRAEAVRDTGNEQNAVRTGNDVEAAQQSYVEELERIDNEVTAGNITQEEAEKLYEENEKRLQEAQKSTQGDEGASSMSQEQDERLQRSLDELITEAKKAFKGATKFRINRENLIFTMPNGLELVVNPRDQIILKAEDEAKARREHGLNEGGIVVEGYAKRLDKGSLVVLSKESREGTTFHEAFHTIWDWVLTDKEKSAMLKHFTPIAKEKGIDVEEAMADGYRDWLLARRQHKGTMFGKLFQKIKDFANAALRVLTGTDNVHDIYRQIEEGKVWNRDAKGRFATEENAVNNDKKFLVTNGKITASTPVRVVDITSNPKFNMNASAIKKAVVDLIKDKSGNPITFTIQGEGPIGRIANVSMGKHMFWSSNKHSDNIKSDARLKVFSDVQALLESAIYVEKHPDVKSKATRWIELYAVAGDKNDNTLTRFRISAQEGDYGSGRFEISDVKFYDIIKDGILSADPSKTGGSRITQMPSTISIARLLGGVNDRNGKPYVVGGKLKYEPGVIKTSIRQQATDKKYMDAVERGDMETAQRMVDEKANAMLNDVLLPNDDDEVGFKYHRGPVPTKTFKRYAVLNVTPDGFKAAYAGNKTGTPVGVWLDAQNLQSYMSDTTQFDDGSFATYIPGDTGASFGSKFSPELKQKMIKENGLKAGQSWLLERGGKHSSDVPNFSQMNLKQDENGNKVKSSKDGALPHNKLIFEIEYGITEGGDLTDYVREHGRMMKGKNQGLAKIQPNQYYDFKTNPNAVGNWGIGGTFKIVRLVPHSEIVEQTDKFKREQIEQANKDFENGLISKSDRDKRIKGANAITLQKWVGGYHPEDFNISVESVDNLYKEGQKSKLRDAVTYDDDGNVIPLSQRFNPEITDDVRYSIRPSDTPLQRTQKLQEIADSYNMIELNAVTAKNKESRKYMKEQMMARGFKEDEVNKLLKNVDKIIDQVMELAKKYPTMKEWQEKAIKLLTEDDYEVDPKTGNKVLKKEVLENNEGKIFRVLDSKGREVPLVSAFRKNGEYPINIDLGTLCMKREAADLLNYLMVQEGKGQNLGPTQLEALKDLLKSYGYLTACDVCFVEAKRVRMLADANKTSYDWKSTLIALGLDDDVQLGKRDIESLTKKQQDEFWKRLNQMASTDEEVYTKAFEDWMPEERRRTKKDPNNKKSADLDTGTTPDKMNKIAKLFKQDYTLAGELDPTRIITTRGTDELARQYGHTDLMSTLDGMYGAATSKTLHGFAAYDSLSYRKLNKEKSLSGDMDWLYDIGGARAQSFTDFNPILFVDYVQMFADYEARRMPLHVYTKVPAFVKLFGKTGVMANMSFVPEIIKDEHDTVDKKGKLKHAGLKYNPKTGKFDLYAWHEDSFPIDLAYELRKRKEYGGRVGIIAVGVSNEHIKKLMADPEIDMVIPYHKSGMPEAVQIKTGLEYATDYTNFQNTKFGKNDEEVAAKKAEIKEKEGKDADTFLNYSRILIEKGDPEKAAQEYLDRCRKYGCTPVFEMFAYKDGNKEAGIVNPGYYKMLEDFRGYDNDRKYVVQGPVRLELPNNWNQILDEALADRGQQKQMIENLKTNEEILKKARAILQPQRLDGEVRKLLISNLNGALGKANVHCLAKKEFHDELEKAYQAKGMSAEEAANKVDIFRRGDGIVYGFAKDGAIYLNENYFNANTPAHEFTHIWAKVAQARNKPLWDEGVRLLKDTKAWKEVKNDPLYDGLKTDDAIASEVLARIVGKANEDRVKEMLSPTEKLGKGTSAKGGLFAQVKKWLEDVFKEVRSIFTKTKDKPLTYKEFVDMPLKALWDKTDNRKFRNVTKQLQAKQTNETHADAIELQAKGSLKEQKEAIRKQYKGTDKWMKAPNGKPTNLTEDQWVTTQTPQFKEWFGDSRVVDENGEPLVVYHGTPTGGFSTFDRSRIGSNSGVGRGMFSFTTDYEKAKAYSQSGKSVGFREKVRELSKVINDNLNEDLAGLWDVDVEDGIELDPSMLKENFENVYEEDYDSREEYKKAQAEAEMRGFDDVVEQMAQEAKSAGYPDVAEKILSVKSTESKNAPEVKELFISTRGDKVYTAKATPETYNETAWKGVDNGADAVILKLDDGNTVVFTKHANQIKDASGNNVSITKDSDNIHYSIASTLSKGIDKAEQYVNRNVREPNMKTAEGRGAAIFNNTYNNNKAQTWVGWLKDRRDKFYREWVDKNEALHKIDEFIEKTTGKKLKEEDKIYNQVQVARALSNGAAQTLVQGSPEAFRALRDSIGRGVNPNDKAAMQRVQKLKSEFTDVSMEDVLKPIMSKEMDAKYPSYLEQHGINTWRDAFSNYLGARRVLELLQIAESKGLKEGVDYKLPRNISSSDLRAIVKNAPKEFEQAAQKYYKLQNNLLILMEDGHLITSKVHDFVNQTYKNYCPLMIDYSDTAGLEQAINQFGRGADSIANVNSMLKYVLQEGSERGLISPLESTYKGIQMLTERAERNKVAVHFVKTVANSPELQKAGLLQSIPGKSADAKNCVFTVLMNGEKVAFKTTQEMYGPIVGYDMPAAGIVEGLCRSAAQTLRAGATTSPSFIIRNFIRDTIFAGVSSRNGFIPVIDSFKGMWAYTHDKELRGEFDAMGITAYNYFGSGRNAVKSMDELMGDKDKSIPRLLTHPIELIKAIVGGFENASEIVEASTRMGEYMRARAKGKSMQEAALDARDVTLDFSRSGFYGQRINTMVPFFNACIQGGDKMWRLLNSKDPKVRMQTARMLGLYIMLPSMLLWIWNKDEPWYEELDPHIRMNNWILPGGKVRIPKPQEAGVLFGSGLEAIMDNLFTKEPHAMRNWLKAMKEVALPNMIPTVGLPLLEWWTNYSLFRDKALEGNRLKRLPTEMRYNSNTTELSKAIGKASGLSPVKLDNTIRGYTGTMGMLVAQLPDMFIEEKQNLPSKPITERAMVRDFFLNDMNMNRTSEDFYELVNTAQQQHAGYGKKGKPTQDVKAINKALRDVSKQQKDIQTITDAKNIPPDRKRQMIDKKREIIKTIQKKTLQRYRDKFGV